MLKLIAQRLLLGIVTLWIVSVLIFAGTEILPGDLATAVLGQNRTPESVAALRASLGLDRPVALRYLDWIAEFANGNIGKSLTSESDMGPEIRQRLGNTLFLAGVAALVAVPLAIGIGLLAAVKHRSIYDRLANLTSLLSISVPEFFISYLLIALFSVSLAWLPSFSVVDSGMDFGSRLAAVALPAATLVLVVFAHMMRQTRAAIVSVLSTPYVEMAVLKGMSDWHIVATHAFPNVLAPVISVVAINLAYLIVGVVVVEVVFVYPGMGQLMVDAVGKRDVPVVQTCGLIFASAYVLLNLIADVLSILSNPRLRHPR
jgi:peptide/nickel transport system permease protein